ncbi:MAG: Rpn family recombination-promoting nuclease/putative transposase [Puniceicoccales bacterium]|jgi:predicted transposase/invertase (TIGR01784 family)|nr:Rpn family recombination-promoting nuclease/putative transposase [Puniceicoccales bacterium]
MKFNLEPRVGTHFARATTDTAFKIMMAKEDIAQTLINDIFRDTNAVAVDKHLPLPLVTKLIPGEISIPLRGKKSNAAMDYHAITENRDHIIIEMQMIHHDDFDRRALFYAASAFANQNFDAGNEWHTRIANVYAIQFLDYTTREKGDFRKYYRISDELSDEKIEGIRLIQIELAGARSIGMKLRRKETLTCAEWWYYILRNSQKFTEKAIERYRDLGMSPRMEMALSQLRYEGWAVSDRTVYDKEVEEMYTYNKVLEEQERKGLQKGLRRGLRRGRMEGRLEGHLEGRLEGQVRSMMAAFFVDPCLLRVLLQNSEQNLLPESFVRKIWQDYAQEKTIPAEKTVEDFIGNLRREGVLKLT